MNSAEHPPVAQPRGQDRTSSSLQLQSEELDQVHELIDAVVADSTKQVYTAYLGLYDRWLEDRGYHVLQRPWHCI